jgi:hypothetical protein
MNSPKDALHGAKTYLDKTHPSQGRYTGDGWLAKVAGEYKKRFGMEQDDQNLLLHVAQKVAKRVVSSPRPSKGN